MIDISLNSHSIEPIKNKLVVKQLFELFGKENKLEIIQEVLGKKEDICNVFSVLEGFRDVGHISLNEDFVGMLGFVSVEEKLVLIKKFLQEYYPDYIVSPAWEDDLFFVHHVRSSASINDFAKYEKWSIEWERQLGYLLGYPTCCVDSHCDVPVEERVPNGVEDRLIPFEKCKDSCDVRWFREYDRIVGRYGLDD